MCVLKYSLAAGTQVEDELHGHDQDVEALLGDDDKPLSAVFVGGCQGGRAVHGSLLNFC